MPTGDQGYIQEVSGVKFAPFMYLGAKHMVTGYEHLLFLVGVIFFLYRLRDIAIYVSLFAVGHSSTLLFGVFTGIHINAHIIDAIFGLSVVYKALDNLGLFRKCSSIDTSVDSPQKSIEQLIATSTDLATEFGQLLALSAILILMSYWRKLPSFIAYAYSTNIILMMLGFILAGQQIYGYFNSI